MLSCNFCSRICKNDNSLRNHSRLCKLNPDRDNPPPKSDKWRESMKNKKNANQFTYGAKVSEETKKKLSEASKKQVWSEERRQNHSIAMKKAVEENPDSYTSSNRGRTKQIIFDGIKFQGQWELEFYLYCKKNNIQIERTNEYFEYEWNGSRKYFPDFFLSEKNLYIEVKGYETERDRAKWSAFPKKLKVIGKEEIAKIRKGCFEGP
jgi:hypothetical protein